jgi:hypothetical protein
MSDSLLEELLARPVGPVRGHSPAQRAAAIRILQLDIETYPALTFQWSLWDKFTPVERIVRDGGMLSIASKWYGEPETDFRSHWTEGGYDAMIGHTHERLCEADVVVTYNGDRFDLPKLRTYVELESGLGPVSPFASVDLFHTVKRMASGYLTGSGVGGNALLMPMQSGIGPVILFNLKRFRSERVQG